MQRRALGGGLCLLAGCAMPFFFFLSPSSALQMVKSHCCCCQRKCAKPNRTPKKDTAVQIPGCRECLSLRAVPEDSAKGTSVWCEQVNDLLCLVAGLKQEVERLRIVRGSKGEIDWWSYSLATLREAQQESEEPCPSYHQEGDLADGGMEMGTLGEVENSLLTPITFPGALTE